MKTTTMTVIGLLLSAVALQAQGFFHTGGSQQGDNSIGRMPAYQNVYQPIVIQQEREQSEQKSYTHGSTTVSESREREESREKISYTGGNDKSMNFGGYCEPKKQPTTYASQERTYTVPIGYFGKPEPQHDERGSCYQNDRKEDHHEYVEDRHEDSHQDKCQYSGKEDHRCPLPPTPSPKAVSCSPAPVIAAVPQAEPAKSNNGNSASHGAGSAKSQSRK